MKTTHSIDERDAPMTTLRARLLDSHEKLNSLLRGVAASIRDDQRDSMHDDCALFERELLNHIDWEEMYLLPTFETIDPEAAGKLRADHSAFRRKLGEIGIEIDIHSIRAERFEGFAEELEAHAKREEAMYATAGQTSNDAEQATLLRRHNSFFL